MDVGSAKTKITAGAARQIAHSLNCVCPKNTKADMMAEKERTNNEKIY
jgi:hypothetical protein